MIGVVLLAHGTRAIAGDQAVETRARQIASNMEGGAVRAAYIKQGPRTLIQAAHDLLTAGATQLVVAPYLLAKGAIYREVTDELLASLRDGIPGISTVVAQPIGFDNELVQMVLDAAGEDAQAFVLLAHGSRDPASLEPIERLREALAAARSDARVEVGFLEQRQPNCATALLDCIASGAHKVAVVPCFLLVGQHVLADLPELIGKVQRSHPFVAITVTEPLGAFERLTAVIVRRIHEALGTQP